MLKRQRTGSVLCTSCGVLVGVNDKTCYNCGRHNPGLWGWAPAVRALGEDLGLGKFIIGTCVVIYVLSLLLSGGMLGGGLAPGAQVLIALGASGYYPLAFGRWWSLLSATWLHGNLIHILSNMYGVWILVPSIAELYGPGRTVIIYTLSGITGFLLSSLAFRFLPHLPFFQGSTITVGASASLFGLLGAAVYYGHRTGSRIATSQAWYYVLAMGAFGFMFEGIDNYAHLGGLGGGYLVARLLDPLTHERIDHVIIALLLLALSIGSVIYSIVPVLMRSFM